MSGEKKKRIKARIYLGLLIFNIFGIISMIVELFSDEPFDYILLGIVIYITFSVIFYFLYKKQRKSSGINYQKRNINKSHNSINDEIRKENIKKFVDEHKRKELEKKYNENAQSEVTLFEKELLRRDKISKDLNIQNNDTDLFRVIEYALETEIFDMNQFQNHFDFDFNKTSSYLDTLKALNILDVTLSKNDNLETIEDYRYLISESVSHKNPLYRVNGFDNLIDGYEFEEYIKELLLFNGYDSAEVTKASNDYGVDVLASKDGMLYAIQCKYYSSTVGSSAVQEIVSGMTHYNAHVGVVATNNYFTRQAVELAKTNNIILWDRDILNNMLSS